MGGDMKVECEDDMDYTPTNRPRPTGEMTEGPDGETDGMTDDGMTEDPNGVTGGSTCKCGLEGERRIVGGEDSTSGRYPWIVSLNAGPAFGSDSHLTVLLGAFDFANDDDTKRKDVALEIDPIVHEDYNNPNQLSNDIALLKLAESVDLNVYTPACMAAKDADYTGKNGRVYGWGSLASCPAQDPTVLQE